MTQPLMVYLDTQGKCAPEKSGARKYTGEMASGYDGKREPSPKWQIEQKIICGMLDDLPPGSWICDAPVGTGRFFEYYQRHGFIVRGVDISADMLILAASKVKDHTAIINGHGQFMLGETDVRQTHLPDKSIDACINCRITRWIEDAQTRLPCPKACQDMFREMMRVSRNRIILTTRVRHKQSELSRPIELFTDVLQDGWRLESNVQGSDPEYRILRFMCKE